jgi:murein DD-endopeptidase MepM/ murein hydrolase activator NlpD
VVLVALVVVLLSAFGGAAAPARDTAPASASRLVPAGPPTLEVVAKVGVLHLQLPVSQARLTAIGFQGGSEGALALDPLGNQANQGLLQRLARKLVGASSSGPRWYQLPGGFGPSTSALDVGAPAGTDVYSPADGVVIAIDPVIIDGSRLGSRIDIQPSGAASLVVSVSHLRADPAIAVGSPVSAGASRLGSIVDFARAESQALARYTNDSGNHVVVEVHPSASLSVG